MFSIGKRPTRRSSVRSRRARSARRATHARRRGVQQQRRLARKARKARKELRRAHEQLPPGARGLFDSLAPAFTRPTFLRFICLALAAILTVGSRTVCNLLRTLGLLASGHSSSFHRVFSTRCWSIRRLGRRLCGWVFDRLVPPGTVLLAGDDTVAEHTGDKVFGKGCHRDAVRSSRTFTAYRWGHKWVVLSVLVKFPFSKRPWALPLLVALYHNEKDDLLHGRKHKTPLQLLRQLCCVLLHWFPRRRFVLTADGNFAAHDLAAFCSLRRGRLTLVSRFYKDANLYELPAEPVLTACGKRANGGRPRKKGAKIDTPFQAVQKARRRTRLNVSWYGGGRRDISVVSGTGHWYKAGQGLVLVSWVHVRDKSGTHEDGYFMSTDIAMTAQEIVETYTARWGLETTFQEMRSYIKLESTRGWKEQTVLRQAPCLFGLYTLVACLYSVLPLRYAKARAADWPGKDHVTFSDAVTAVRRWLWVEWVFAIPGYKPVFEKLSRPFRSLLLNALAPVA